MSVGRVTEITAMSSTSFEDAIKEGIDRATKTLRGIQSAWVKEQEVKITDNQISGYEVTLKVTFLLEDAS
jgi:hypothetical protein